MADDGGFRSAFLSLTTFEPFRWQERLFQHFLNGSLPFCLDLPTGLGKTSVMAIWYLARNAGAPLPRRLVYVVDRRAVVDQATDEAEKIEKRSGDPDLRISTLRGKLADNRKWLEDPASPAIIVGTVDMIGSRLLFEGYGVSRRMRPYHAGLLGADTLVVLDESHLVPPFELLLEQIAQNADLGPKGEADRALIPRFHLLPLSATGRERGADVFRLTEEDQEDPVVKARLEAEKRLRFEPVGNKKLEERLAEEAWALSGEGRAPVRILTYCNSRDVAEKTKAAIEKLVKSAKIPPENLQLFVGARRVMEREDAKKRLEGLGFFSGNDAPEKPAFVVATSAGEVGVDLDADHMVMDLVPFERMVQRLGRVNRLGSKDSQVILLQGDKPEPKKKDAPTDEERRALFAWKAGHLLRKLPCHDDGSHDASPGALVAMKVTHSEKVRAASTPDPLYPALNRPLVDAWSMTSLREHSGRPEVQPWLRGWVDDLPQTTLIWRKFLPVRVQGGNTTYKETSAFFAAAPPHLTEKLETESYRVHDWLKKRVKKLLDAAEKTRKAGAVGTVESEKPLGKDDVVAYLLGRQNEPERRPFTVAELSEALQNKRRFLSSIAGMTLVLDARFGGLSEDGLLDDKSDVPVRAADGEDGWRNAEEEGPPLAPFRVRRVKIKMENGGDETADASERRAFDVNWHPVHVFDAIRDREGNAAEHLIVEKWQDENSDEDARSVAGRAQSLNEHQDWAAARARGVVGRLGLEGNLADAIVIAAQFHDEGKKTPRWQDAFHTSRNGRPYAKTGNGRAPDFNILDGYRHEFGSLLEAEKSNSVAAEAERDLILHLIAAHHGRARPVIETNGAEGAPSALEARARDVTLRFARLQKRFGPWGLAWLEALLRAADQQASRDLEAERVPDG